MMESARELLTFLPWRPAALVLPVLALGALARALLRRRRGSFPPGPRPLPLLGNVLDLPRTHIGKEFREISAKYGDVVYLSVLGQPIILLGAIQPALDLFEKRSANYSDRPPSVMGELTGWDWALVLMNNTPGLRHHRRLFHKFFEPKTAATYHPAQVREARRLLAHLVRTPEKFTEHLEFAIGATILGVTYGIDVDERTGGGYLEKVRRATNIFTEAFVPGRYPVELFPALRHLPSWLPGGRFKATAARWRTHALAMRDDPFATVQKGLEAGTAPPCIASKMLDDAAQLDGAAAAETLETSRNVAGVIYVGAAETSNTSMQAFMLLMALNPDVQARAQAELDAVVGQGQLPDFADRARLPYMNALVLELLRWHPVPLGFPRRAAADDVYNGWLIPRGAIVVCNVWAVSRDPREYPDPERFWPDRFLKDGKLNPAVRDPNTYAFGFGRRVCPGRHFGDANLWVLAASILHVFRIGPPVDEHGCVLPLEARISRNTITARVEPFRCTIEPRSPQLAALARAGAGDDQT